MPHAVDDDVDDANIAELLGGDTLAQLGNIHERELDTGEKANDAEDFEDIGDDDLIEEEDGTSNQQHDDFNLSALVDGDGEAQENGALAPMDVEDDPFDDLFNDQGGFEDAEGLSPASDHKMTNGELASASQDQQASFESLTAIEDSFSKDNKPSQVEDDDDLDQDPAYIEQMRLFKEAQERRELPPAPQTADELFSLVHPQFERNKPPRFSELLPTKRRQYPSKQPLKPPKPVHPTKVNLELQPDQEKSFRLPGAAFTPLSVRQAEAESAGLILTIQPDTDKEHSDGEGLETLGPEAEDDVGQYKWADLVAVCQDWNIPMSPLDQDSDHDSGFDQPPDDLFGEDDQLMDIPSHPAHKKQKLSKNGDGALPVFQGVQISFDDPELETAKLAKRVRLDMNDPHMLVDVQEPAQPGDRKRKYGQFKRDNARGLTKDFARRYNISNDEAYDQLKENRQSKIRSTLGSLAIEHSLPAARLQYPFYKVHLSKKEARSFHRPYFNIEPVLFKFTKLNHFKRKEQRRRNPQELYTTTETLTQGDNSHVLLLEYSEEYPVMLSGFGMGNRLINYYRRRDEADHSRPKFDVGETEILTREDKSPFSIFGDVDPGLSQPTISNGMYRAPVFAHEANPQDFLLVSSKTSQRGRELFLKNVENLHVVGQEFPSVEVPGTHSRKVTDASKRRMKMLSYRLYRKHKKLKNEMMLKHLPGSDVAQNRSKMREFMHYEKDRGWFPREAEVPDEATIRSWIKPEDICLLESMQVGDRQLRDSGYSKDEEMDDDEEGNTQTLDQQLAPWNTTKNFLNACQGKAMLQLHGEGDPSGRGEAFNFIRTSMKGGFKPQGESVEERLGKNSKELGGHSYNVARQNRMYTDSIRKIWDAQRNSLSSTELQDADMEDPDDLEPGGMYSRGRTPSSAIPGRSRRDDDVGSMFSRKSARSEVNQVLRIRRTKPNPYTGEQEQIPGERGFEEIRDPKIIREYKRRKGEAELEKIPVKELLPTGDKALDDARLKKLRDERDRLLRNAERHDARARQKGLQTTAASPEAASPSDLANTPDGAAARTKGKKKQTGQTQRKCANCGMVGHIKTNKRECPMLNGTMKQPEGFGASAFGSLAAPTANADGGGTTSSPADVGGF